MSDSDMARTQSEKQFWNQLDGVSAVMMGLLCNRDHMQPMAPFGDPSKGKIWFFSKVSSDLVRECGAECSAHISLASKDDKYFASAQGRLRRSGDLDKLEEYWNPVVAAWYEHGKDDPDLAFLELTLEDAAVWNTSGSVFKFGWEIAKANFKLDETPDVGERDHITFESAAA